MRVIIAMDSFTGSMTASAATSAVAEGWRRVAPDDELVPIPLSDGGPGFVDVLARRLGGDVIAVPTTGPWGEPASGRVLIAGSAAYVEVAQAAGGEASGDPGTATSAGIAPLVQSALAAGARRLVIGLGGTVVTDGGAGLLGGLGARATDRDGTLADSTLLGGGAGLAAISHVDLAVPRAALADMELVIATDVDSPLLGPRGAARGYGPQKGADPGLVDRLEESLRLFAHACGRLPDGRSPAVALGAGAAGGLGFALFHLGGTRIPGIQAVMQAVGLPDQIGQSDLVITGEGRFDWQSLHGKVVFGVSQAALARGRPVLVLAGQVAVGRRDHMAIGVSAALGMVDPDAAATEVAQVNGAGTRGVGCAG